MPGSLGLDSSSYILADRDLTSPIILYVDEQAGNSKDYPPVFREAGSEPQSNTMAETVNFAEATCP